MIGLLLNALPRLCAAADDPHEWLEKMNRALATRNYDGTFFHLSDGRVETMRIVHRVRAGRVTERLVSLDGSGREFVRNNDELTCYLPDQHTVLVEPRQDRGPFLGSLPQFGADVNEFYRIESLPNSHVLGRAARVLDHHPAALTERIERLQVRILAADVKNLRCAFRDLVCGLVLGVDGGAGGNRPGDALNRWLSALRGSRPRTKWQRAQQSQQPDGLHT